MLETVLTYIEEHQLLPPHGEVIVAISGGADSLCLLHLLNRLCGPGKRYPGIQLHAAHLDHMLRGAASTHDAATVASIAAAWNIPFTLGKIDVPALARQERRSLEEAARIARYRFLRKVAHGQPIAIAHHADDQAETLVLHWLRGSGLTGMVGMQPRQQDLIRPLLVVTHAETVAYCQAHGIEPVEDLSNTDPRFLRNRVRHELLPLLQLLNPGIQKTLLRNAEVVRIDVEWLETQVDTCWPTTVASEQDNTIKLNARAFTTLPLSLQRHLVRRVTSKLCDGQSPLEPRHFALIEQLLSNKNKGQERSLDLPQHIRATYHLDAITFARAQDDASSSAIATMKQQHAEVLLPVPGAVAVPGTPWIAVAEIVADDTTRQVQQALNSENWAEVWRLLPPVRHAVYVDGAVAESSLLVRTRRPGDRMQPLGMLDEKKVQDILVDKRVARSNRAAIPLFFSTSHCIWLADVCLDHRARLTRETRQIVRLSIQEM